MYVSVGMENGFDMILLTDAFFPSPYLVKKTLSSALWLSDNCILDIVGYIFLIGCWLSDDTV
mgnify:CR=1 FL=1